MKQLRLMLLTVSGLLTASVTALADTAGETTAAGASQGSMVLQAVALLVALGCVLAALKLHTAIRGGRVAQGWIWVFAGLLVFAAGQAMLFAGQMGFLPLTTIWVDALRVVSLLLLFVGINQLRKIMA